MDGRPFKILGVQQVAIGGRDKSTLVKLWCELLGLTKTGSFTSESENVDEDIVDCGGVEIDLMVPVDADKRPRVHEPALNHVGLWVDDLRAAVSWLESKGVRFAAGGVRKGASGHDVCFIHPKGNDDAPIGGGGVLIELVQSPTSSEPPAQR